MWQNYSFTLKWKKLNWNSLYLWQIKWFSWNFIQVQPKKRWHGKEKSVASDNITRVFPMGTYDLKSSRWFLSFARNYPHSFTRVRKSTSRRPAGKHQGRILTFQVIDRWRHLAVIWQERFSSFSNLLENDYVDIWIFVQEMIQKFCHENVRIPFRN